MESPLGPAESGIVAVSLPDEYPLVLLVAVLLCTECLLFGHICVGRARQAVYQHPEVEKKIEKLHLVEMGRELRNVKGGYPDTGSGRFSSEEFISYTQWL